MGDEDYMKIHSLLYGVKVYENLLSSLGVKGFTKQALILKQFSKIPAVENSRRKDLKIENVLCFIIKIIIYHKQPK